MDADVPWQVNLGNNRILQGFVSWLLGSVQQFIPIKYHENAESFLAVAATCSRPFLCGPVEISDVVC